MTWYVRRNWRQSVGFFRPVSVLPCLLVHGKITAEATQRLNTDCQCAAIAGLSRCFFCFRTWFADLSGSRCSSRWSPFVAVVLCRDGLGSYPARSSAGASVSERGARQSSGVRWRCGTGVVLSDCNEEVAVRARIWHGDGRLTSQPG